MGKLIAKQKQWLIGTIALLLIIWGLGPFLAIGSIKPLASFWSRIIPTIILIGIWSGYFISHFYPRKFKSKSSGFRFDPNQQVFKDLRESISLAWQTIKKFKHTPPWILLLGPNGSGKTALLKASNIELNSSKAGKSINWWFSQEAVFVDPTGTYCLATKEEDEQQLLWHTFLYHIKRHRRQRGFDAIILTLDLATLVNPHQESLQKTLDRFSEQLNTLAQIHRYLNISIVITHCDQITGFTEFFEDLSIEERQSSFGFNLEKNDFKASFDEFIKHINHRLVSRLHHEPNLDRRIRIKDFPIQLGQLQSRLATLMEVLNSNSRILTRSLYFTSSQQSEDLVNVLNQPLAKGFALVPSAKAALSLREHSTFASGALNDIIATATPEYLPETPEAPKQRWAQHLALPIAIAIILTATGLFHHSYQKNVAALKKIDQQLSEASDNPNWLAQLNTLNKAKRMLADDTLTPLRLIGFGQAASIRSKINTAYKNSIQEKFSTYLNQTLTTQIDADINGSPLDLYSSLQAYLMLTNKKHYNKSFFTNWFKNHWKKQFSNNPAMRAQLDGYLNDFLAHGAIRKDSLWPINKELVKRAQAALQKRPLAEIGFMMLKTNNSQKLVSITTAGQTIADVDLSQAKIPAFYSKDNFNTVYQQQIPALAQVISKGNWVIGKPNIQKLNHNKQQHLEKDIRTLYLQAYKKQWQIALSKIKLDTPQDFTTLISQINLLRNQQSPLWQLYFSALKASNQDTQSLNTQATQSALTKLQQYLSSIDAAPSSVKAAFKAAEKRFNTQGKNDPITGVLQVATTAPEPVQSWLNAIGHNSWILMLADSKIYLNSVWKATVLEQYNQTIKGLYPIYKDGKTDITAHDFNQFFGPSGIIGAFFNNNLKAFINTHQAYWTWKKLDGEQIAIPQSTLDMLIRASMIQKMFYTDNANTPTIKFKLTPISMSTNVSQFVLNIGGQMIQYMPGIKHTNTVKWPGPDGNFITMRFDNLDPKKPTQTTMGTWAWLHLLDTATIKSSSDPRSYEVIFHLKDNQASYQLTADNPINPYLPNVLSAFRCPSSF